MTECWRELGCSDYGDVPVELYELDYVRTKNHPMHVWNAILHLDKIGKTEYPKWIREYLIQSAKNLKACDPKPNGRYGVVAAFGLIPCSQLFEPDIGKIRLAYDLMKEKVQYGRKSVDKAASEVEYELDQSDFEPTTRGSLAKSAIVKLYSKLKKIEDKNIDNAFEQLK